MTLLYLIAGTYRAAGMERVLANKTNWLAGQVDAQGRQEYDIVIATTDQRGRPSAFPLDSRIRTVDLGIDYEENNGRSFLNKLIRYPGKQLRHRARLKALIRRERPDVVVSMFCNDAGFVPAIANGARTVLEIHFSRFKRLQYGRKGFWALADRLRSRMDLRTVSRFDHFVVLTEEDAGYWGNLPNLKVIPNARTFTTQTPSDCTGKTVLACGRYNNQKAFDRLIEAWSRIMVPDPVGQDRGFSDWKLRIAGAGEEEASMREQIDRLGLTDSVILGPSSDMEAEYRNAGIFALTSRYEGLPMVLLEAQAYGLPIVSMACKCGPRDVIHDGVDGFLVPEGDVEGFAEKLTGLMNDDGLRRRMGAEALRASDRFDEERIMTQWSELLRTQ